MFCCIPRLHAPFPTNGRSASGPCEDFRQVAVGYGITPQHCPCTIRLIVPWPSRVWLVFETRWCIFVAPRRKVPILLRTSGGLLSDVSPLLGCDARGYSRGVKDTRWVVSEASTGPVPCLHSRKAKASVRRRNPPVLPPQPLRLDDQDLKEIRSFPPLHLSPARSYFGRHLVVPRPDRSWGSCWLGLSWRSCWWHRQLFWHRE